MQSEPGPFDLNKLSRCIGQARGERGVTWKQISHDVGVAPSTIRRFATAADAEADGVLALVGWLGVAPEAFVANSAVAGTQLLPAGEGVIRVDMAQVSELSTLRRRAAVGPRTTIQRLVVAAQASERTVASLTRWSST